MMIPQLDGQGLVQFGLFGFLRQSLSIALAILKLIEQASLELRD